jgi:hypothetical protein
MEYYSALKEKEILPCVTTQMNEPWGCYAKWNDPVTKKDKYLMIPRELSF